MKHYNNIPRETFQLTTSRRGRPFLRYEFVPYPYFNSLPHAEVDDSGKIRDGESINFNSLPHAEVDGRLRMYFRCPKTFQLTTSRRGRLEHLPELTRRTSFQLTTSRRGRQQFVTKSMDINHRFHNKSHNKSLFFALIILCLSIFH